MSVKPAYIDIDYYSGDEMDKSYAVTDADGAAVNLTGVALIMQVKRRRTDPVAKVLAEFRTDDNTLTVSGANGNIVTLSGAHALDQNIFYQDMERQDVPETVWYGKFLVIGDVTRT